MSFYHGPGSFGQASIVPDQYENDNTFLQASKIVLGETQDRSFSDPNDVDFVYFVLEQNTTVDIRTYISGTVDTGLTLYFDNYTKIDSNDDYYYLDSRIFVSLQAGVYVLEVDSYSNGILFNYQLSLDSYTSTNDQYEPNNDASNATIIASDASMLDLILSYGEYDYFNFTLLQDRVVHVDLKTAPLNEHTQLQVFQGSTSLQTFWWSGGVLNLTAGTYCLEFHNEGVGDIPYNFSLVDFTSQDINEPNDQRAMATPISHDTQLNNLDLAISYPTSDVDWYNVSLTGANAAGKFLVITTEKPTFNQYVYVDLYNGSSNSLQGDYRRLSDTISGIFFPITVNTEYVMFKVRAYDSILNYSLSVSIQTQNQIGFDDYDANELGFDAFQKDISGNYSTLTEAENLTRSVGGLDYTDQVIFELPTLSQFAIYYSIDYTTSIPDWQISFDLFYHGLDNSTADLKTGNGIPYGVDNSVFRFGGPAGFYRLMISGQHQRILYTLHLEILPFVNISTSVDQGDSHEYTNIEDMPTVSMNQTIDQTFTRFSLDYDRTAFNVSTNQPVTLTLDVLDYEVIDPALFSSVWVSLFSYTGNLSDYHHTQLNYQNVELTNSVQSVTFTLDVRGEGKYFVDMSGRNLQYASYSLSLGNIIDSTPIKFIPPVETTSTSTSSSATSGTNTSTSPSTTPSEGGNTPGNSNLGPLIFGGIFVILILLAYQFRSQLKTILSNIGSKNS